MATINLGSIKFNWKGTYAGGTAYVVDDVVSYSGSSYICKLASTGNLPTNGTYWDVMSQAGTNGTDVGTTITTQGDLLYRDGSGLQRLAKGTAGQALIMNTGATAPEWGSGGKAVECLVNADDNVGTIADGSYWLSWNFTPTISGKVFLTHSGSHRANNSTHYYARYSFNNGSGEVDLFTGGFAYAVSSNSHNQTMGGYAGFPSTGSNSDSTTIITVTAGTQCTFRVKSESGGSSGAASDSGKDHTMSAIIFES